MWGSISFKHLFEEWFVLPQNTHDVLLNVLFSWCRCKVADENVFSELSISEIPTATGRSLVSSSCLQ